MCTRSIGSSPERRGSSIHWFTRAHDLPLLWLDLCLDLGWMDLQAELLPLQEIVEFLNQARELRVIFFFGDLFTEDLHALSFFRGHRVVRDGREK